MLQRINRLGQFGLSLLLLVVLASGARVLAGEHGQPFISWYSPQTYGAGTQNWAITQGPDGVMYFGNDGVILVFDGAGWTRERIAPGRAIRSLASSADGRILVGSQGEFGYLKRRSDGGHDYVSLAAGLPDDAPSFTDVWQTFEHDGTWYFSSRQAMFQVTGEDIRIHRHAGSGAGGSFLVDGKLYTDLIDSGLSRFDGDGYERLPGAEPRQEVFAMVSLADGRILIGTRQNGLYIHDPREQTTGPTAPESSAFLAEQHIYHGVSLADGRVALATLRSGVVIVDPQADELEVIDRHSGLPDVRVWHLFADAEDGMWLAMDNGVARIESGGALSRFDHHSGLEGPALSLARHQGVLHAGTTLGLYRLVEGRFETIEGIDSEVWDLIVRTDKHETEQLLAATSFGVFAVNDNRAERISEPYLSTALATLPTQPWRVWVGTYDRGLGYLDRLDETWSATQFTGLEEPVRRLQADDDAIIWVETWLDGLARLDTTEEQVLWRHPPPDSNEDATGWNLLPATPALIASRSGIWQWHEDGNLHPRSDLHRTLLAPHLGATLLAESQPGVIWAITTDGITQRVRVSSIDRPESAHPLDTQLGRLPDVEFYTLMSEGREVVWIGGADALYRVETDPGETVPADLSAGIRSVTAGGQALPLTRDAPPPTLGADDFPVVFGFSAPAFDWPEGTRYRYRLVPLQTDWSEWRAEAWQEFAHLPPGNYRFEAQARDVRGRLATTRGFEFEVPAPWYQSLWVTGSAALLLAGMIPMLLWLGGHRQARYNARLEALVAERTGELQRQKRLLQQERDRFDHLSRHDELTGLPNRRHGKKQLERAWRAALDGSQFVSLALIDIDHFKRINDDFGHDTGDRILVEMAELLHSSSRPDDVVVRWGGEEFLLLFPGTGLPDAVAICHRIGDLVAERDWGLDGPDNTVSLSIGVTATRGRRSVAELLSRADELLYSAKRNGRARVEVERENW